DHLGRGVDIAGGDRTSGAQGQAERLEIVGPDLVPVERRRRVAGRDAHDAAGRSALTVADGPAARECHGTHAGNAGETLPELLVVGRELVRRVAVQSRPDGEL